MQRILPVGTQDKPTSDAHNQQQQQVANQAQQQAVTGAIRTSRNAAFLPDAHGWYPNGPGYAGTVG